MRIIIRTLSIALLIGAMAAMPTPVANAGRLEGPLSTVATAPGGLSVFFNLSFVAGDRAIVSIAGDGKSMLHLIMYDADGHTEIAPGDWDRKTVWMDIYRTGVFRIEVRNIGSVADTFRLITN